MQTKRKTGIAVAYDDQGVITWRDIEGKLDAIELDVPALAGREAFATLTPVGRTALLHGIDQKVTDAGAMGTDHWDGADKPKRAGTTAERMARMRRVRDGLAAGQWTTRTARDPLANLTTEQLQAVIAQANAKLATLLSKAEEAA